MSTPSPSTRPRRPRLRRIVPLVLGGAVAAVALSGCIAITNTTVEQEGEIGPIDVVVSLCASKPPACAVGNTSEANDTGTGQVLIGVRVDSSVIPAQSFTGPTSSVTVRQPFTLSPTYAAELTRLSPPGAGKKWVGYISDTRTYDPGVTRTVRIPMTRPRNPDGSPGDGTNFSYAVVAGARVVSTNTPADRDVTCGASLTTANVADFTICQDQASPSQGGGGPFNDFGFVTPAPVTVQAGQTATIPIAGKLTGPAAAAINFALSATTDIPGATALTNVPTLAPPGDSTTTVVVSVAVPAGTKPGTYGVTLTGTLGSAETRSATATVTVPKAGGGGSTAGGPSLSRLKLSKKVISNRRGKAPSLVSADISTAGRVTLLLERQSAGRRSGRACVAPTRKLVRSGAPRCLRFTRVSSSSKSSGGGTVTFTVSGRAAGRPRPAGAYRVTLTGSAGGLTGAPVRSLLTITG